MAMPKRFAQFTFLFMVLLVCLTAPQAFGQLSITPSSWNVVGLDSNKVTAGPDTYPVGVMIKNNGSTTINNVTGRLVWDSTNIYINLAGPDTANIGSLAAGVTTHLYFMVTITRNTAAYDTARRYHIEVWGDGASMVSTPTPRELYVEHLVSQFRNSIQSIGGPSVVFVGQTYSFTLNASTAPGGYEQLETFLPFPASIFQVLALSATYTQPAGATNNKFYADASGWDNDPTSPTYRSSIGPEQYLGGKAGGNIVLNYTVKVIGAGAAVVSSLIYDFSGSSYHYNSDYGSVIKSITSYAGPTSGIDLVVEKSHVGTAVKGGTINHTVIVTNIGDMPSNILNNITVQDPDPVTGKVTVTGGSGTNWSYLANTFTYTGSLASGQSAPPLTVQISVESNYSGSSYDNIVTVAGGGEPPGNTTNNTGNDSTAAADPLPDLAIVKSHTGNFLRNTTGQYTITVRNIGTGPTTSNKTVTVTDTLPSGLTFNSWTGTGWTYSGGVWTRKDVLAINSNYPDIVLTVNVLGSALDSETNSVTVATTETESDTTNNAASDPTTIESPRQVSGTVYNDANHNGVQDAGETGTGLPTLYAKLILDSAPTTVYQWVQVTAGTGSFTISCAPGRYRLIVDDNNTTSDVTPNVPGWLGTQIPNLTRFVTVPSATNVANQNFGLYNGSRLTGKVIKDDGTGGGIANDGVLNGSETGLYQVTVQAKSDDLLTTHASTTTDTDGTLVLWLPATTQGNWLRIVETNLGQGSYISVSGDGGTTSGTYDRPGDYIRFQHTTAGIAYTSLTFGDVLGNSFSTDNTQSAIPGSVVTFRHQFIPGSGGTVTFTTVHTAYPNAPWNHIVYYDANGNGVIDAGEGPAPANIPVTAYQQLHLIVAEFVPPGLTKVAQAKIVITPNFTYSTANFPNNGPVNTDIVSLSQQGSLKLIKGVDKASAKPGDLVTYTITYLNLGTATVTNVVISDPISPFCIFQLGQFGGAGQDIRWVKPDGSTKILSAATGDDEGGLEGHVNYELGVLYVRMNPTTIPAGRTGTISYVVKIK